MEENNLSPEARLKQIKEESRQLKQQIFLSREEKLKKEADERLLRDDKIEKDRPKIEAIQKVIYDYNKLGKVGKDKLDIFGKILAIIQNDIVVGPTEGEEIRPIEEGYLPTEEEIARREGL